MTFFIYRYMIKKWKIFNESIETFTEEMAQEIIYYFGENSSYDYVGMINHRFDTLYVDKDYNLQDGIFYHETGYDEMKEMTTFLYNKAKKDQKLETQLILLYKEIREQLNMFPEICEIEDMYLNLIESEKMSFFVDVDSIDMQYTISLKRNTDGHGINEFIEICKKVEGSIARIQSSRYKTTLDTCKYSSYELVFKIILKS